MPTLPAVMEPCCCPLSDLFDPRTWRKAQLLAMGAILSPGKRTVSSALNILGIGQHGDFAVYHHVLNRRPMVAAATEPGAMLLVAGRLGSSTEPLVFGIDETVDATLGPEDCGQGAVSGSGAVQGRPGGDDPRTAMGEPDVADAGWAGRHWALPFLTALVVSARYDRRKSPAQDGHRLRPADAGLPAPLAARDLVVVADGGYAKREFLRHCQSMSKPIVVVTKLRKDASRYQPGPPRRPGQIGRPRVVGARHTCIGCGAERSRYPMDPLPCHRVRRQYRHGRARFGRSAVVPRRAAAPSHTLGRHQTPGGAPRALCKSYAPTPRRNPCGYCSGSGIAAVAGRGDL